MMISEIEQAIAELSLQELTRFRTWFEEFERDAKDLSIIEERCNEPGQPLHEYLKEKAGAKW